MNVVNPQIPQMSADSIQRDSETYAIIGAAMTVHNELGCGFLEAVYQAAFAIELTRLNIPFSRETELPIVYRGQQLPVMYRSDFICFEEIIVELKALDNLTGKEEAQVLNYLKATGIKRSILLNFGAKSLQYKRLVREL